MLIPADATDAAPARTERLPEGVRFAVIGFTSTLLTVIAFNLLVHRSDPAPLAAHPVEGYLLAMVVGTAWSFVGNRWWVFDASGSPDWVRDLVVFVALNLAASVIPSACLVLSRSVLHQQSAVADNVSANLCGLLLATVFRFYAYKWLVFGGGADRSGDRSPVTVG